MLHWGQATMFKALSQLYLVLQGPGPVTSERPRGVVSDLAR